MANTLDLSIPKDSQEEIKEFVSVLLLLPKEDRAILLSNANAFKTRNDIEKIRAGSEIGGRWGRCLKRFIQNL